jgi:predicted regulator of Ras-like GTPase activity (Roadblock/LC7/MglB family)
MREIQFDLIRQSISELERAPYVRAVLVCQISGNIVVNSLDNETEQNIIQQIPPSVLPATRRIAEKLGNPNEFQSVSLPDDNLYLLTSWLTDEYFLVVSFSQPVNPYSPPQSFIKTCDLLRYVLQSEHQDEQTLSSKGIDLQTEIYVEQLLSSKKIIKNSWYQPNLHDLSFLEVQSKKVVEIAQDILSNKKGIIEGARLLVSLRPTVTRDDFDVDFIPFIALTSETDALPVGDEREYWASDALQRKDKEIQEIETAYRDDIFSACKAIIKRFESNTKS